MHLNILRDLGAPKQQKAHVLQITPCSFQVWRPPQGFPHSLAASGQLIFWLCFHGYKIEWVKRKGEKNSCNRWHLPAWKMEFSQTRKFFPGFFSQESRRWDIPWCGGRWALVGCPCCLVYSEYEHGSWDFNAIFYGLFAAIEVAIWLKTHVFYWLGQDMGMLHPVWACCVTLRDGLSQQIPPLHVCTGL